MVKNRVLLVDDDNNIRDTLSDILREKGFIVEATPTGQEALTLAKMDSFDAALIDLRLGDMDGTEVLKKLKKIDPNIVCIIITGYASIETTIKAMKDDVSGFFIKPLEIDDMLDRITEVVDKKRLIQEVMDSEKRYRALFEGSIDAIFITDQELKFIDYNKALMDLFGFSKDDVIGSSLDILFSDQAKLEDFKKRLVLGGYVREFDLKLRKKDSTLIDALLTACTLSYSDGSLQGFQGIIRDITSSRLIEQELENYRIKLEDLVKKRTLELTRLNESLQEEIKERGVIEKQIQGLKEFNENIVQKMEEGVLIENADGRITFANPRMLKMLECDMERVIDKHWRDIFSPSSANKVAEENDKLKRGQKTRFDGILDFDGKELYVMVSAAPLLEYNSYKGNLKVFVDITERKRSEERLRHRALRYKVEKGRSYLILEKNLDKGLIIFRDLLQARYKGTLISRTLPEKFGKEIGEDTEILWLSEKKKGRKIVPPQLDVVKKSVEDRVSRDSVVLLDRLDYLIVQNDFMKVLKFIQELNEFVYTAKGILIIVVDPGILSGQELILLEKELMQLESKQPVNVGKGLLGILEFVKEQNEAGHYPVHKDIVKTFGISQPTAIKRLKELKRMGLLTDRKHGRFKALRITENCKMIL